MVRTKQKPAPREERLGAWMRSWIDRIVRYKELRAKAVRIHGLSQKRAEYGCGERQA